MQPATTQQLLAGDAPKQYMAKPFNTPFQDKLKRPSALYPEEKDFKRYRRATTVSSLVAPVSSPAGPGGCPTCATAASRATMGGL